MARMPNSTRRVNPTRDDESGGDRWDRHSQGRSCGGGDRHRRDGAGTRSFATTGAGYRALVRWLRTFGEVAKVGVEGTGSYGAGIYRQLVQVGMQVWEVDRPDGRTVAATARTMSWT